MANEICLLKSKQEVERISDQQSNINYLLYLCQIKMICYCQHIKFKDMIIISLKKLIVNLTNIWLYRLYVANCLMQTKS